MTAGTIMQRLMTRMRISHAEASQYCSGKQRTDESYPVTNRACLLGLLHVRVHAEKNGTECN